MTNINNFNMDNIKFYKLINYYCFAEEKNISLILQIFEFRKKIYADVKTNIWK